MTCGRPRAHGLVERIPHTHRHIVTDTGLHHALLFTHAHTTDWSDTVQMIGRGVP
jgi:hypothetical protein